jgi:hypothetical protein
VIQLNQLLWFGLIDLLHIKNGVMKHVLNVKNKLLIIIAKIVKIKFSQLILVSRWGFKWRIIMGVFGLLLMINLLIKYSKI